jgi:hypothetical protein
MMKWYCSGHVLATVCTSWTVHSRLYRCSRLFERASVCVHASTFGIGGIRLLSPPILERKDLFAHGHIIFLYRYSDFDLLDEVLNTKYGLPPAGLPPKKWFGLSNPQLIRNRHEV